jgi:hypothetical protein
MLFFLFPFFFSSYLFCSGLPAQDLDFLDKVLEKKEKPKERKKNGKKAGSEKVPVEKTHKKLVSDKKRTKAKERLTKEGSNSKKKPTIRTGEKSIFEPNASLYWYYDALEYDPILITRGYKADDNLSISDPVQNGSLEEKSEGVKGKLQKFIDEKKLSLSGEKPVIEQPLPHKSFLDRALGYKKYLILTLIVILFAVYHRFGKPKKGSSFLRTRK